MGGDPDDQGPYRSPVELPEPPAPPRSARVLSGLAQLKSARGDVEEAAALSERAARARASEPARKPTPTRPLGRCVNGHVALVAENSARALAAYKEWLASTEHRKARDEHYLETYSALATTVSGLERDEMLREAVQCALRLGQPALPEDAPPAASALLARTFRELARNDLAAQVIGAITRDRDYPLPPGTINLERAHLAFAAGNVDDTAQYLRAASMARSAALGERHPAYAECVTLAGRVLHRARCYVDAERMFVEALDILRSYRDVTAESETLGALAELFDDLPHRRADALVVATNARSLASVVNAAPILPALGSVRSVLANAGLAGGARAMEQRIAAIHTQYAP